MNKITIIGAGMVGSTTAYSIIAKGIAEEIAIIDTNERLAEAQVMDLQHAVPFFGSTRVKVGDYEDVCDSRIVVMCAGAAQREGQSRLDLIQKNSALVREITPKVFQKNPDAIFVMVTNPVDILTYIAIRSVPEKKQHILGTGTLLDSARFRHLLGEKLRVNPRSIHAYIVGEHGDSELPFWSMAVTGSMSIDECRILTKNEKDAIFENAKNAAYAIIAGKQATYYAIGAGTAHLCSAILGDKRVILPVSHLMEGDFGITDMCLSVPVVVGKNGVSGHLCITFSEEEQRKLRESAEALKRALREVEEAGD
jgi:L-lactate dehydrogenase